MANDRDQFQIGEFAEFLGLSVPQLRRYDRLQLLVPAGRTPSGYPDHELAPIRTVERADRSDQQPSQARQTGRVRVPTLPELPDLGPALRRQA